MVLNNVIGSVTSNWVGSFRRLLLWLVLIVLSLPANLFSQTHNPVADPKAIVIEGNTRFTVLTPDLIRLEWSANRTFEDRPSLAFINRKLAVPTFSATSEGDWLVLATEKLTLRYKKNSGKFGSDNLEISFIMKERRTTWHPGKEEKENLFGTIRTLDGVKGKIELDRGLISRDGCVLVDDGNTPLFDASDWQWVVARDQTERQDWYFFGYGQDYKKGLGDFTRVAGKIPMPPKYVFDVWWSRYWSYTDEEFKDLVQQFELYNIPLGVLVVDMDWHLTFDLRWGRRKLDQAGQMLGWTGYTWDNALFPDPEGFLEWCKKRGLRVTMNLHPASGIQPHEEAYPHMARAMGIDPATKKYIPFQIINKKFAENYFDLVLRPHEKNGVDFWWIDWQQWDTTQVRGLNPTWWLNYTFFTDMERQGKSRPVILARWGGLGNHRYQIGFSGDVITDWSSLEFQLYFTATAANVAFGYWSHDIGGHIPGTITPELYTRWIQWGIFSPIIRTHTTKNPEAERRIWAYPYENFAAMKEAFQLRHSLIPYIYTEARKTYESGISICRPLYYDYPDFDEAFSFKGEYLFGDQMLVAPVATPIMPDTLLASKNIWLPPGTWFEWHSGKIVEGPVTLERSFALDEIPVYVKAGSIVPMQSQKGSDSKNHDNSLKLMIFPGDSGSYRVYKDAGSSLGYQKKEFAWTPVSFKKQDDHTLAIRIDPVKGTYPGMVEKSAYEINLVGVLPPQTVVCNGQALKYSPAASTSSWRYDGHTLTAVVSLPEFSVRHTVEVRLKFSSPMRSPVLQGFTEKQARLRRAMNMLNGLWSKDWSPPTLIEAVQTGNRITLNPKNAVVELEKLDSRLKELPNRIKTLEGDTSIVRRTLNHLSGILVQ